MRVCFVPSDFDGCAFYRCFIPAKYLQRAGWEVCSPPYSLYTVESEFVREVRQYDLSALPPVDVLVFQRPGYKNETDANREDLRAIRQFVKRGVTVVVDNDDNSARLPDWHPAKWQIRKAAESRPWLERCMGAASWLSVSTSALEREYRRCQPRVRVVPNYLDWEMWEDVVPQFEVRRERVRIGWMGHISYREGDLEVLRPWVHDFLVANPDVDFVVSGNRGEQVHELLGVPVGQRVHYEGVMFRTGRLPEIVATMDVGLVPLQLDDESRRFNDSKSWLKGLEYSACGVVPVCSPSEPYRELIKEGVNGYLAGSSAEWWGACDALVREARLRRVVGAACRDTARAFSVDRHISEWEEFYRLAARRSDGDDRRGAVAVGGAR